MTPVCSIIIPSYNHAAYLADAVDSALAQTVDVEVIVVDDGSTDQTQAVLATYEARFAAYAEPIFRVLRIPHGGPSAARNAGIEAARGEFVMFLDADDVIAPDKVEAQLAAFDDAVGWVMCDVRIEDDVRHVVELASQRYRYPNRQLGGWIREQLAASNFIPIMSPLVRRSVLGDTVRFSPTLQPEDWHFWYHVAAHARVRYVPQVLATYRKRRTGRSRLGTADLPVADAEGPIKLNLGCGTPGAASWHPMPGCVNLDRSMGWCFEDGLPQYADRSVAAITVSHALMYVHESDWPKVCAEFLRVLEPGGVLRITEDETVNPASSRRGGWRGSEPAVTLTSPAFVRGHLEAAGFAVQELSADASSYRDTSLCQAQHGQAPDVFFIEGTRPSGVLFSPHADDETLFAAYTIQRYKPAVVICFGSAGDYGETAARTSESRAAVALLGGGGVEQWDGGDLMAQMRAYDERARPAQVWAPAVEASHPDHVAVARVARAVFGDRVSTYHTYDTAGKVRAGQRVEHEPSWTARKLKALAAYESQIAHPRANQFFQWDLHEYQEAL